MSACVCVCACAYACAFVSVSACIHVCAFICVYMCVCVCTCVHVYVCTCKCVLVCRNSGWSEETGAYGLAQDFKKFSDDRESGVPPWLRKVGVPLSPCPPWVPGLQPLFGMDPCSLPPHSEGSCFSRQNEPEGGGKMPSLPGRGWFLHTLLHPPS